MLEKCRGSDGEKRGALSTTRVVIMNVRILK